MEDWKIACFFLGSWIFLNWSIVGKHYAEQDSHAVFSESREN